MIKLFAKSLFAVFPLIFSANISHAAGIDQNVCAILANKLTPDISSQTSAEERFKIYQNLIRNDAYRSFGAAKETTLDAGLSVPGYVDATLGTTSDESNWETNWSKFLSMSSDEFRMSKNSTKLLNRWNPKVIESLLEGCSPEQSYGQLVAITSPHDGFTIKLRAINAWALTGVSTMPSDPMFNCGGDEKATETTPIAKIGDRLLSCTKDPNKTITVTIRTSFGDAGPFEIFSVADSLRNQTQDAISAMQSHLSLLEDQLADLKGQVSLNEDVIKQNTAAVQLSKSELVYTIASGNGTCPLGWDNIGRIGFLIGTGSVDAAALSRGGPFGGGEWTWTHPFLCKRH